MPAGSNLVVRALLLAWVCGLEQCLESVQSLFLFSESPVGLILPWTRKVGLLESSVPPGPVCCYFKGSVGSRSPANMNILSYLTSEWFPNLSTSAKTQSHLYCPSYLMPSLSKWPWFIPGQSSFNFSHLFANFTCPFLLPPSSFKEPCILLLLKCPLSLTLILHSPINSIDLHHHWCLLLLVLWFSPFVLWIVSHLSSFLEWKNIFESHSSFKLPATSFSFLPGASPLTVLSW